MRGGSKGVPKKNMRELYGKPLMAYTIEQALRSKMFEHVVVSTDSDEILETAISYGAEAWFKRPLELATDKSAKLPAIRHALLEAEKHYGKRFDVLVDLDATSPLRKVEDILRAYRQFVEEDADILITACPARKNPYFNMVEVTDGSVNLVKHNSINKMLVSPNVSIRESLSALSKGGEKCLIVVNSNNKLLGTLSDGDLRKAILKGVEIDEPITKIYNTNSVYLKRDTFETDHAKNIFIKNKFDLIPIVDEDGIVVDFIVWEEIFAVGENNKNNLLNIKKNIPTRRQDASKVYDMNASIYIWKRKAMLENDTVFTNRTSLYIMPEERSVDIDTELDWNFVEFIFDKSRGVND